jgi:hypothetical protein
MAIVYPAPEGGRWVAYHYQEGRYSHWHVYLSMNGFLVRQTGDDGFIDVNYQLMFEIYPGIEVREW